MGLLFCIIVLQLGLSWVRYYPNCNFWFVPKCHFAFSHVNRQTSYEKPAPKAKRPAPPPPTARQAAAEAKRREAEAAMRWPQAYNDDDDDQAEDDDEKPITPPPRPKRISERERDVWDDNRGSSRVRNRFTPDRERDLEPLQTRSLTQQQMSDDNGAVDYEDEAALEAQLQGEAVQAVLRKSTQGFGFTIVGGDSPGELLQIKSIVKNGVAARSGQIFIGDVLVKVNGICVLTYTHHQVVQIFQGLQPGAELNLELRRGYELPIDPDNPDAPITPIRLKPVPSKHPKDQAKPPVPNNAEPQSPLSPLGPPLTAIGEDGRPVELIQTSITKGQYGFGFTIAETAQGQKIKQIMDQGRCVHLRELDLLVQVNGQDVRNCSHGEVVSLLKQCPKDERVTIVVERVRDGKKESNIARQQHQIPNNQVPVQTTFSEDVFDGEQPDTRDGDSLVEITKEVVLKRQAQGFGFRLVGGREEGTQVYIGTIVPGGAADKCGELDVGDEIIYVNGRSCAMATHKEVVARLSDAGKSGQVTLHVRKKVPRSALHEDIDERRDSSIASTNGPCEVVLERRPDGGFGFVLQSSVNETGCTICRIIPESPAEFCKKLHVGDRLLAVNGKDVTKLHHSDVVGIIKRSGLRVTLHVDQADDISVNDEEPRDDEDDHFPPPPPPPEDLEPPHDIDRYHPVQYDHQGRHGIEELPSDEPWRRDGRYEHDRVRNEPDIPGRRRPDRYYHRESPPPQQQPRHDWDRHNDNDRRGHFDDIRSRFERGARGGRKHEMPSHLPDQHDFDGGHRNERRDRRDPPQYRQGSQKDRYRDHQELNNRADGYFGYQGHHQSSPPEHQRYNLDPHGMPSDPEVDLHFGDGHYEGDVIDVALKRDHQQGFGFSIRGGQEYQNTPLFILRIADDGVAYKDGRLRVGDEILEINGEDTADMRHTEAISLIKRGGDYVRLKVIRPPPEQDGHISDGIGGPRRDRRDYSPPRHHPAVNQAVDSYFDQYMDSVRHRQGNVGYPKQGYKNGRGMGYNAA
jgi:C-terminal processing protease CtpA/Prc